MAGDFLNLGPVRERLMRMVKPKEAAPLSEPTVSWSELAAVNGAFDSCDDRLKTATNNPNIVAGPVGFRFETGHTIDLARIPPTEAPLSSSALDDILVYLPSHGDKVGVQSVAVHETSSFKVITLRTPDNIDIVLEIPPLPIEANQRGDATPLVPQIRVKGREGVDQKLLLQVQTEAVKLQSAGGGSLTKAILDYTGEAVKAAEVEIARLSPVLLPEFMQMPGSSMLRAVNGDSETYQKLLAQGMTPASPTDTRRAQQDLGKDGVRALFGVTQKHVEAQPKEPGT